MDFNSTQAIYLQIADYMGEQILIGKWTEGERILSVRELGVALEVNPNTVMRAYELMQNRDIIFNKRGIGFFVSADAKKRIKHYWRKQFIEDELPVVFKNMELLDMTLEDIMKEYNTYFNNKK